MNHFVDPPPRRLSGLALLYTPDRTRFLMLKQSHRPGLGLPGGAAEAEETLHAACGRQVAIKIGLDIRPGRLLVVHHMLGDSATVEGMNHVFDGGAIDPDTTIIRRSAGVTAHSWMTLDELTAQALNRQLDQEAAAPYTAWRVRLAAGVLTGDRHTSYVVGHPPSDVTDQWRASLTG